MIKEKTNPALYLLFGIGTITAAHMTISIDLAGWIASVPFLLYLRNTSGVKSRLLFLAGLIVAWSFCIVKIVSPPMPFAMVFLFSVPISLFHLPGYLLWDKFRDRPIGILVFPAAMAVLEWIQYSFTPFASWGVAAYTQSHTLSMMQAVSVFGMPGLSFLIYWVNVSVAELLLKRKTTPLSFQIPVAVTALFLLYGALRVELSKTNGADTICVAAVGTDSDVTGFPLPSVEKNAAVQRNLFRRTETASQSGARIVVWNEASTFVLPADEKAWKDSLSGLAKRRRVALVAAFIIPLSETPMKYENKYLFFDSAGTLMYTYHKHQPVPGEPAVKGTEPLQVFDVAGIKAGSVICYDYDFPYLARGFGKLDADLVADPSSDWRGIDPLHTRMAAFRAVEQGHSILRSTRFGLSAAITPYGELTAQMSSFDTNDKIMMAYLPVKGAFTFYTLVGDIFVYLCIGYLLLYTLYKVRRGAGKDPVYIL